MGYSLSQKQKDQLSERFARDGLAEVMTTEEVTSGFHASGFDKVRVFHDRVGLPIRGDWSYIPPVSERILRAKLLLEEVLETFEAMGLEMQYDGTRINFESAAFELVHVEGSQYDPIETADGLADIKVIANGTAVCFGIPQQEVDHEVWCSNMTKIDESGKPIVNECTSVPCETRIAGMTCDNPFHLVDGNQPVGKILKPKTYTKANIARLYVEHTTNSEIES